MRKCGKFITSLLVFVLFISLGCAAQDKAASLTVAPDFKLEDLNGRMVSLSDYKNKKAVVLLFWTTWCSYCREELRKLNQDPGLAKYPFEVLTINVGESRSRAGNYAKAHNLILEVLMDQDSLIAQAYGLMGVPAYFVINKAGEIVSEGNQFPKDVIKELRK